MNSIRAHPLVAEHVHPQVGVTLVLRNVLWRAGCAPCALLPDVRGCSGRLGLMPRRLYSRMLEQLVAEDTVYSISRSSGRGCQASAVSSRRPRTSMPSGSIVPIARNFTSFGDHASQICLGGSRVVAAALEELPPESSSRNGFLQFVDHKNPTVGCDG